MDSFSMSTDGDTAVRRLRFRIVRKNPETLDPGAYVLVGTRHMGGQGHTSFPCVLQWSVDGYNWDSVEFVNGSLLEGG